MALVDVVDAGFSYGTRTIFDGVSFAVSPGEVFCLIGPNGCGKTTLLDCILGLHGLRAGAIRVQDRDVDGMPPAQRARVLSYVPQNHERTFPYSVLDIVTMGRAAYLGMFAAPTTADRRMARDALEQLGIAHLSSRPYTRLSGGETQLVMIARALVQQTPVVIMDEPTAHLDFRYELLIMEVITRLVKSGLSIIMATHFPNHAFYLQNSGVPTRIALMHDGDFLAVGSPDDVLDEDRLKKLYGVNARIINLENNGGEPMKHIVPLSSA